MQAEAILKELHEIRTERTTFVKYDRDRYLRKREKELWATVKRWYVATYQPDEFKALQETEERERTRIAAQNKVRVKQKKVA